MSEEEEYLRKYYHKDVNVDHLMIECDILLTMFKDERPICFQDVIEYLKSISQQQRSLIPNVTIVCKLLLVNPANTATAERSFSLAKRMKT